MEAQQTAFTYQGKLGLNGQEANGIYDARFALYDSSYGGSLVGNYQTNSGLIISNGYFLAQLDFGSPVFSGGNLWLDIGIRTNGAPNFTSLTPRQSITPTPYAITAAHLSGSLPASQITGAVTFTNPANTLSGRFSGDGSGLTNVQALPLTNYPTLNGSNNFSGFSSLTGNISLVGSTVNPTNIYPGTGSISANYGTQTFTGSGNPFLKFQPGWNFAITNDQYTVINVINPNQVTVFETVSQTYVNQTNWTVYPNGLTFNDINQHHFGWVGNDASIGIIGGKEGGNSGQLFFVQDDHAFGMHMTHQGDGSYLAFDSEGFFNGGSFKISDAAIYDSLVVKPNGLVSMRFGATNEHGALNLYGQVNAPGTFTAGNLTITGSISGNGAGITNIPGSSINGIANAISNNQTGVSLIGHFSGTNATFTNAALYDATTITGQLNLVTNASSGTNPISITIPSQQYVKWYGPSGAATMRWNDGHSPHGELEFVSGGRIAISPGYDATGSAALQLGAPGYTHEEIYLTMDGTAGSTDGVNAQNSMTNFTTSKVLHFYSTYKDTNGVVHTSVLTGVRSETLDQNGTTEVRFYNPATNSNPAGNAVGAGIEQFAIGTGYTRTDGGQLFGVNVVSSTPDSNYFITWTNVIDAVTTTTYSLTNYTTNWLGAGNKKDVIYYCQYGNVSMAWPSNWVWLSPQPNILTNNTVGRLSLVSTATNDSGVLASWSVGAWNPQVDTNVSAFVNASGITMPATVAAISRLVSNLKQQNLWTKLTAFYPFVGGTATSDSLNLINPSSYPLSFYNTLFFTNGLRGDGNLGFANTGLSTSIFATSSECLEFIYIQDTTPPKPNAYFWSADAYNSLSMNGAQYGFAIGPLGAADSATIYANLPNTNYSGFLGVNVHLGVEQWYTCGANAAGSFTSAGITSTSAIKLFGQTGQNLNYSAAGFGSGFTSTDVANLISTIKTFETSLGR